MKLILDLHGILVEDFPLEEYEKRLFELLFRKFDKKYDPPPKVIYENFRRDYETISDAMYDYGLTEDYLRMMDTLPTSSEKDLELVRLLELYEDDVYVATNTSRKNALNTLKEIGFNPSTFARVYTGDDVDRCKPSFEMYEKIIEGRNPKDFLVIGNRVSDLYPAQELGMYGILGDNSFLKRWLRAFI